LFLLADESGAACDTSKQAKISSSSKKKQKKKTILMARYVRDVILLNSQNKTGF
jgi:hypothetical protein